MKIIDRYTISKWSENIDGVRWCKSESVDDLEKYVAKLEAENKRLHRVIQKAMNQIDTNGYVLSIGEIRFTLEQALKEE